MEDKEKIFTRLVRETKSTVYTVCYMFSNDEGEVGDLFQETSKLASHRTVVRLVV